MLHSLREFGDSGYYFGGQFARSKRLRLTSYKQNQRPLFLVLESWIACGSAQAVAALDGFDVGR